MTNHLLHALYGLAQCYGKLEKTQQAVTAWRRYIAAAPDSPWRDCAKEHLYLLTGSRE